MITKYFSEKTKKDYSTIEACEAAEKEWDEAHAAELAEKEAVKKDANEIQNAYNDIKAARKKYEELVSKFIKNHKNYHLTISDPEYFDNLTRLTLFDLFDRF